MARNRKRKAGSDSSTSSKHDSLELPEDEQWRIVRETGILDRVPSVVPKDSGDNDESPLADEIFNSVLLIIPFSFLLLMMEILIHRQYGQRVTLTVLSNRMVTGIPIMSLFIFYSSRYKHTRQMQACLFFSSIIVGVRLLYLISRGSWLVNMKQCPPLATAWVFTVAQLDLGPSVVSLGIVGAWVWWKGLKFTP